MTFSAIGKSLAAVAYGSLNYAKSLDRGNKELLRLIGFFSIGIFALLATPQQHKTKTYNAVLCATPILAFPVIWRSVNQIVP